MDVTLKEKIVAIIWGTTSKDAEIVANTIIKEIENRVNEIEKANLPENIRVSNMLSHGEKSRMLAYAMALRDVREMLKDGT